MLSLNIQAPDAAAMHAQLQALAQFFMPTTIIEMRGTEAAIKKGVANPTEAAKAAAVEAASKVAKAAEGKAQSAPEPSATTPADTATSAQPASTPAATTDGDSPVVYADVQKAVFDLSKAKGRPAVEAILAKHNLATAKEAAEALWPTLVAECTAALTE